MRLNQKLEFLRPTRNIDKEGFGRTSLVPFYACHAYVEAKHLSERWLNFSKVSDVSLRVVLRFPPKSILIEPSDIVAFNGQHYEIDSINDLAFRKRYLEIFLKEVIPNGEAGIDFTE